MRCFAMLGVALLCFATLSFAMTGAGAGTNMCAKSTGTATTQKAIQKTYRKPSRKP